MRVAYSDHSSNHVCGFGRSAKPVLHGTISTEPNLFHHGETTYRDGWMIWICYSSALERRCLVPRSTKLFSRPLHSRTGSEKLGRNGEKFYRIPGRVGTVLKSVDLWIKGCVKSRAFLLRHRACFPYPSARAPASQCTDISTNTSSSVQYSAKRWRLGCVSSPAARGSQDAGSRNLVFAF